MSKVREILRLRWALGRSVREASRAASVSVGVVSNTERRATRADLNWTAVEALHDAELERRLYGGRKHARGPGRLLPDGAWMHAELRRAGVTLELLHLEYLREHPDGYRYTAFCDHYRKWLDRRGLVMRQQHKAGDKTFVDYSGSKPHIVDPTTGEVDELELFVAVLGASNLTYAEATRTQTMAASTRADPFAVVMTGLGAVSGPLHGKAALAVHRMFERAAESSPELALAHAEDGAPVAAGFGHPVYCGSDPRAAYLLTALAPLMKPKDRRLMEDVTKAASRAGLAKPNVDFALGALAFALDMPFGATEAIFATARSAGWIAHALEEYGEAPLRFRSRAVYIGPGTA